MSTHISLDYRRRLLMSTQTSSKDKGTHLLNYRERLVLARDNSQKKDHSPTGFQRKIVGISEITARRGSTYKLNCKSRLLASVRKQLEEGALTN
jgi:hypothetical protein